MKATVYVHCDKETMYEKGQSLGLTGQALDKFMYACYEVKLDLEVDEKTGLARITHVDDRQVSILQRKS